MSARHGWQRLLPIGLVVLMLLLWVGCDSGGEDAPASVFVGTWTFEAASVNGINVTGIVRDRVDQSEVTFEEDGSVTIVAEGEEGRAENSGTYTVDRDAGTITFRIDGYETPAMLNYEVHDEGSRVMLKADDVQLLAQLAGVDVDVLLDDLPFPIEINQAAVTLRRIS